MPSLTLKIAPESKLHARIISAVRDRIEFSKGKFSSRHEQWKRDEEKTLAYMAESASDAKRKLARDAGKPQYTTIVIPYSYGVLMASHTYWTTVFMSRQPVLQYSGRHGESVQQTQAVEALMDYQMQVGGMQGPLYIWLLDVGKYGVGVMGSFWEEEENTISEMVEEEQLIAGIIPTGRTTRTKRTRKVPGYVGNRLYNVRPYDFFPDPRVPIHRFQDGEFCGVYNELGWNTILRRAEQGFYTNIDRLRKDNGGGGMSRIEGSSQMDLAQSDGTFPFSPFEKKVKDVTKIYEITIELVPSIWGLGKGNSPEKWVFSVTTDWKFVIGAQPLGAFHNKFPFHVIEFEPEGYSLVNRGIPEILDPVQRTMDWLINTHFYNIRKALNDQFLVDPSRVVMKDVQDPLPGGMIRLKEGAYGTNLKTDSPLEQLRVVDLTQGHLRDIPVMLDIGQRSIGVNDQIMGALPAGGRRTATEIRTSSTFGINRLKTEAEYFSIIGWTPMSQMLLQNSQQYYDMERKFRIVGDLAQEAGPEFMQVSAESIQGFYDFVPIDGTLPVDRFAMANLWRELMGSMVKFPQVAEQYDMGRIFAWVAQLAGLKNINQFKIQVVPDEQAARDAQRGNIVPIPGQSVERPTSDLERVPEPGQVSGLGTTG